jgi:hypothetical protein
MGYLDWGKRKRAVDEVVGVVGHGDCWEKA